MCIRDRKNVFTNPSLFFPSLIFPLFFFTAFAGGLSRVEDLPNFDFRSGYTAFQFSFVLMQASAFGGVFTGFAIARDFESGFGRRMMLAAPRRSGLLAGYALSALVRALFIQALVDEAARRPHAPMRSFIPELGDRQRILAPTKS